MLYLEVVGAVRPVTEEDLVPAVAPPVLKKLRDSHHAVARLLSRGVHETEVSHITGYALSRISTLKRDPMFQELIQSYRYANRDGLRDLEAQWAGMAADFAQHAHECLLDEPESVSPVTAIEIFKTLADRSGYAPVSRSLNKNINLNIGEQLDAARRRRSEPA